MTPIKVSMPPALFTNHLGVRYAIAGSDWLEVPIDTRFEDLSKYMVFERRKIEKPKGNKTWSVSGSTGKSYTVTLENGQYSCTCAGFGFRRKCRHINEIKNEKG